MSSSAWALHGLATSQILPTVHCLTALEDADPFCITLSDVDIVSFERVMVRSSAGPRQVAAAQGPHGWAAMCARSTG